MCISALIEAGGDDAEVLRALDRSEACCSRILPRCGELRRTDLQRLDACLFDPSLDADAWPKADDAERQRRIRELIEQQIGMLIAMKWSTAAGRTTISTTTPRSLAVRRWASHGSRARGPARRETRGHRNTQTADRPGKASIIRQRNRISRWTTGEYLKYQTGAPDQPPVGQPGPFTGCNVAMRLWGDTLVTDAVLKTWLDRLFARNLWLDMGESGRFRTSSWWSRSPVTTFSTSALLAPRCASSSFRKGASRTSKTIGPICCLRLQEKDGSWWDFPMYDYHQQYGTAFPLMSLAHAKIC